MGMFLDMHIPDLYVSGQTSCDLLAGAQPALGTLAERDQRQLPANESTV